MEAKRSAKRSVHWCTLFAAASINHMFDIRTSVTATACATPVCMYVCDSVMLGMCTQ